MSLPINEEDFMNNMNSENIDQENLPINEPNITGGEAKEPIRPSFVTFVPRQYSRYRKKLQNNF